MTAIFDFQKFMKAKGKEGQSLHRSELMIRSSGGDDQLMPLTKDYDIEKLELTPQLMKDLQLEQAQKYEQTPQLNHNLSYGPGGSSSSGPATIATPNLQNRAPKPPKDTSGE